MSSGQSPNEIKTFEGLIRFCQNCRTELRETKFATYAEDRAIYDEDAIAGYYSDFPHDPAEELLDQAVEILATLGGIELAIEISKLDIYEKQGKLSLIQFMRIESYCDSRSKEGSSQPAAASTSPANLPVTTRAPGASDAEAEAIEATSSETKDPKNVDFPDLFGDEPDLFADETNGVGGGPPAINQEPLFESDPATGTNARAADSAKPNSSGDQVIRRETVASTEESRPPAVTSSPPTSKVEPDRAPASTAAAELDPSSLQTATGEGKRRCYDRDKVFLEWYEKVGSPTYHSHAKIRDKWNKEKRDDVTRQVVIKGVVEQLGFPERVGGGC